MASSLSSSSRMAQWITTEQAKMEGVSWWTLQIPTEDDSKQKTKPLHRQYHPQGPSDKPVLKYPNGDMYWGHWEANEEVSRIPSGSGCFPCRTATPQRKYQVGGGHGVYACHDGMIIAGEWKKGKLEGKACQIWNPLCFIWQQNHDPASTVIPLPKSGSGGLPFCYWGHFRHSRKWDPQGVTILKDGSVYCGPWEKDRPVGTVRKDHARAQRGSKANRSWVDLQQVLQLEGVTASNLRAATLTPKKQSSSSSITKPPTSISASNRQPKQEDKEEMAPFAEAEAVIPKEDRASEKKSASVAMAPPAETPVIPVVASTSPHDFSPTKSNISSSLDAMYPRANNDRKKSDRGHGPNNETENSLAKATPDDDENKDADEEDANPHFSIPTHIVVTPDETDIPSSSVQGGIPTMISMGDPEIPLLPAATSIPEPNVAHLPFGQEEGVRVEIEFTDVFRDKKDNHQTDRSGDDQGTDEGGIFDLESDGEDGDHGMDHEGEEEALKDDRAASTSAEDRPILNAADFDRMAI